MENIKLDFLTDFKLKPVDQVAPVKKKKVVKLPTTADLRVYSTGKIYPSAAFATANELEYQDREELPDGKFDIKGNGVDIWSSKDWSMVQGQLPQDLLFAAIVPKAMAKVDLWMSTNYNSDHTPKGSVYTQGAGTFGKNTLLPMLTEVYGIDWEKVDYVDLSMDEQTLSVENGIYHIPKIVASGKSKGEATYIRRQHIEIHPLVVSDTQYKEGGEQMDLFESKEADETPVVDAETVEASKVEENGTDTPNWAEKLGS